MLLCGFPSHPSTLLVGWCCRIQYGDNLWDIIIIMIIDRVFCAMYI